MTLTDAYVESDRRFKRSLLRTEYLPDEYRESRTKLTAVSGSLVLSEMPSVGSALTSGALTYAGAVSSRVSYTVELSLDDFTPRGQPCI